MKKILVWESHSMISGGQKMTLLVAKLMQESFEYVFLLPEKGALSNALDEQRIPYYLLGNQSMPAGVKGISVLFRYAWLSIKAVLKGLWITLKERPDIIYAPGPAALPWSAICGMLANKPVVWHLHHIFLDGPTKRLLNAFSSWKRVKTILAVSRCVGDQIQNEAGRKKVEVIYNPVDCERYAFGDSDVIFREYPEVYNHKDDIKISHIALMQQTKRQELVIDVVRELTRRGVHAIALLVGGAKNKEDEAYLLRLRESCKDISDRIFFLGYRSDVENVLKCLDCLIIPSVEGFPLAGLEANSAGVPVVCANKGGGHEYVQVSQAGCIFQFDSIQSAADAVLEAVARGPEFKQNAVAFVRTHDIQTYSKRVLQVFREPLS